VLRSPFDIEILAMTTRRRLILSGATIVGGVVAVLIVLAILPTRPSALKEQFDRIEVGMTQAKVEAILGKPSAELDVLGGAADRTVFVWSHPDGSHAVSITTRCGTKIFTRQPRPSPTGFAAGSGWPIRRNRVCSFDSRPSPVNRPRPANTSA